MKEILSTLLMNPFDGIYHAGNFVKLGDSVVAAAFGGSYEGRSDTAIYLTVTELGGPSGPRIAHSVRFKCGAEAHWNPVLFALGDGRIGIIFKVGNVIASWRSLVAFSSDGGVSWSEPRELVPGDRGGRGPVRNKPVRLSSGRWLSPASLEDGPWRAFVDISDDDFKTLRRSSMISKAAGLRLEENRERNFTEIRVSEQSYSGQGVIQPTLWTDERGVHMLLRSTYGCLMRSDSVDEGETWCGAYPIAMPNNNSGIDLDKAGDTLYLACNPISGNWGARTPLSLYSSTDGLSFAHELDLETREQAEFSYPCVRIYADRLFVSYTYNRENIRLRVFSL